MEQQICCRASDSRLHGYFVYDKEPIASRLVVKSYARVKARAMRGYTSGVHEKRCGINNGAKSLLALVKVEVLAHPGLVGADTTEPTVEVLLQATR